MGRLEWDGKAPFLIRDLADPSTVVSIEGAGFVMWVLMGHPALGWQSRTGQKNVPWPSWGPQHGMVMALLKGPKPLPVLPKGQKSLCMTHSVNTAELLLRDPQCPLSSHRHPWGPVCPDSPGYELGREVGHLHQLLGLSRIVLVGSPTRSLVLGYLMGIVSLWPPRKTGRMGTLGQPLTAPDPRIAPALLRSGPAPGPAPALAPPPGDAPGRCAGTGRSYK